MLHESHEKPKDIAIVVAITMTDATEKTDLH